MTEELLKAIVEEIHNSVGRDGNPSTLDGTAARLILEARGMIVRMQRDLEELRAERDFYRAGGVNYPRVEGKCSTSYCTFPRWPGRELCISCDPSPMKGQEV